MGYDDVIVRSVLTRKRCIELCLQDKRLPCRSADFWEGRKECRLSREDRRSQPGSFVKSQADVDYIENACIGKFKTLEPTNKVWINCHSLMFLEPAPADRGKECEWEVTHGAEFKVFDFTTKSSSMADVGCYAFNLISIWAFSLLFPVNFFSVRGHARLIQPSRVVPLRTTRLTGCAF